MNGDAGHDTLDEALRFLASFTDYEQKAADLLTRRSLDLDRMRSLCAELGNPERHCGRVFHVAGSKGKGSVTLMLDQLLRGQGVATGRFLSPHLEAVTERIAVAGRDLTPAGFAALVDELRPLVARREREDPSGLPSFFEAVTLMAFLAWRRAACHAVALEVGLGGRLDATNVVDPLVAIITMIDLEHTRVLGDSIGEIAGEKAGILKPGRPALSVSAAESEAGRAIARRAAEVGAPLFVLGRDFAVTDRGRSPLGRRFDFRFGRARFAGLEAPVLGRHQIDNLGLAIAALLIGEQEGLLRLDEETLRHDIAALVLPARQQFISRELSGLPCDLLLDSAHTPESTASLARTLDESFPDRRRGMLLGMLRDKKAELCMRPLAGRFDRVFLTEPDSPRAMKVDELAAAARVLGPAGSEPARVRPGLEGLDLRDLDLLVVAGSVYLAGEIARELRRGRPKPPGKVS